MNQSFDAFASLLAPGSPAAQADCNPTPPTPASLEGRTGVVTFLPSSNSTTSMDSSCVELHLVPSYPAVAPPPSPSASRNLSAPMDGTRAKAAWRATRLEAKTTAAEETVPPVQSFGEVVEQAFAARGSFGTPQTIPEHGLPLEQEDSLTKIFFTPHSEDESLAGRMPGRLLPSNFRTMSPLTAMQTSSDNVTSPRSPPSAARVRNLSVRSARRRSAARRASRAAAVASNSPSPPPPSPPPKTASPSPQPVKVSAAPPPPQTPSRPLLAMMRVPREAPRTVSSPLSSPNTSSSTMSLATRSPSPCASNRSNDVKRQSGFAELSFYRRSLLLREKEKTKPRVSFSRKEVDACSTDSEAPRKEDREGDGKEQDKEKSKTEKNANEVKRATAPGSRKKSAKRRRNRRSPEISCDEQAMRDEISYLRTEYLPKLLAEAEADSVSKSHKAGGKRYAGARPRDALLLRAGLLPAHLSPWRRSLQAQLRKRDEARRRANHASSASRLSNAAVAPPATTPVRLKGVAPDSSHTTLDKRRTPILFPIQLSGSQINSPFGPEELYSIGTEMILKPPHTASFDSNYSVTEMDSLETPPTRTAQTTDTNSLAVSPSSSGRRSVTYSHVPRLFDPALMTVLRKRSSECVLETKRVPPQQQEQPQSRRWQTLLSTAGVQRRAAEEQRRRRLGEGAHETWARRARLNPRPLVGAIFDRKPFYGAPGPNCNPLPWQH